MEIMFKCPLMIIMELWYNRYMSEQTSKRINDRRWAGMYPERVDMAAEVKPVQLSHQDWDDIVEIIRELGTLHRITASKLSTTLVQGETIADVALLASGLMHKFDIKEVDPANEEIEVHGDVSWVWDLNDNSCHIVNFKGRGDKASGFVGLPLCGHSYVRVGHYSKTCVRYCACSKCEEIARGHKLI